MRVEMKLGRCLRKNVSELNPTETFCIRHSFIYRRVALRVEMKLGRCLRKNVSELKIRKDEKNGRKANDYIFG